MTKVAEIRSLLDQGKRLIEIHRLTGYSYGYISLINEERKSPGILGKRRAKWQAKNPNHSKERKKINPEIWRKQKTANIKRHQDITKEEASRHYKPWRDEDKRYLKEFGQIKTMEEMALELGRTYLSILGAGDRFGIDLRGDKTKTSSTR